MKRKANAIADLHAAKAAKTLRNHLHKLRAQAAATRDMSRQLELVRQIHAVEHALRTTGH